MSLYRMKFTDQTIGDYWGTFWVNDYLIENNILDGNFADSVEECIMAVDNALNGSSEWQMFQQAKYNNVRSLLGLVNAITAMEFNGFYPVAEPLSTVYTSNQNISYSKLNGYSTPYANVVQYQDLTGIGGGINSTVTMLGASPFNFALRVGGSASGNFTLYFNFYVLKSSVLGENNTLVLDGSAVAKAVTITLSYVADTGRYTWNVQSNASLIAFDSLTNNYYNGKGYEESPVQDDDPWNNDDDPSGDGGGSGADPADNYDENSDTNDVPPLPVVTASDTGFITLYNPTIAQLKSLANYLWGGLFDVTTWKKVMADPMDAILGLSIVPVNVPSSGASVVTVGNISTGISLNKASSQFVELDCGSLQFPEKWKAYLDYSPYTKVSIYLPYIGSQEIDVDLIEATTIGVKYHIDVLSGACVAFITVNNSVMMQFSGQCAVSIPVTSTDYTQTIIALGQLVASGIGVVATGGMSAPVQGASVAGLATAMANTAQNVIASKPTYAKTGNMSGSNGLMGFQKPYLIIERPRKCSPAYQNNYTGYPSYSTRKLSELSGFTQVQDIHLDGIPCNDTERNEIMRLLREGVIL